MSKYNFQQHLQESLKDPNFQKLWKESDPEYQLSCKLIELRLKNKISQSELAKKAQTTQSIISKIESMSANPSFETLKKISSALNCQLTIGFISK